MKQFLLLTLLCGCFVLQAQEKQPINYMYYSIFVAEVASNFNQALVRAHLLKTHADDPAFAWLVPDQARRAKVLPGLFRAMVDSAIRHGRVWHTPGHGAATVWRMHDSLAPTRFDMIRSLPRLLPFLSAAGPRAKILSEAIHRHFPREPFRYLQIAGCDPQCQGKGLGSAVVREGLEYACNDGVPVYLETAQETNLGFYRTLGFKQIGEYDVPEGGPHFWQMMWRA